MIAITLSACDALYSFTRSITFWCDAWSPCDILSRATFMPASASFHIISLVLVEGPIVHTIFVLRLTFGLDHTPFAAVASCWIALRCWKFASSCQRKHITGNRFSNFKSYRRNSKGTSPLIYVLRCNTWKHLPSWQRFHN